MKNILITGSNGQLGQSVKTISTSFKNFNFIFKDSKTLDISNYDTVKLVFSTTQIDFCINCAAYTQVDLSEKEEDKANEVNIFGVENLAKVCDEHDTTLIHISTDFVFDGKKNTAYLEYDKTNPIGVYGKTKLKGEKIISESLCKYFIIRTSWLYSEFKSNFMKTMLKLGTQRETLSIVSDQIGTPTYAVDLAKAIIDIIKSDTTNYGIYHYSNLGAASWYDFAKAIFELENMDVEVKPIKSIEYPTPARRPSFSILDTEKIRRTFDLDIPYWRDSLKIALTKFENGKN